jgi:hypothetical protein
MRQLNMFLSKGDKIMPRPWYENIREWPSLAPTKWYLVRIIVVERVKDSSAIRVTIEFLEQPQEGRRMDFALPLPVRPAGLTAEFFSAAGIGPSPRRRIRPRDGVGRSIRTQFGTAQNQPVAFKPAPEGETTHERKAASASGRPPDSATQTPEPDGNGSAGR